MATSRQAEGKAFCSYHPVELWIAGLNPRQRVGKKVIQEAKKPVMTIRPLAAAGKILPPVGLAFVWATLLDCDRVMIGTTTPDEAQECLDLSQGFLERRTSGVPLQETRSKQSLK